MTKLCNSCEYLRYCARSGIEDVGCDRYKKDTTTNKEWLQTCDTEQLAEWLNNKIIICAVCDRQKNCEYFINETCHLCPYHEGKNKSWELWLKQPHQ